MFHGNKAARILPNEARSPLFTTFCVFFRFVKRAFFKTFPFLPCLNKRCHSIFMGSFTNFYNSRLVDNRYRFFLYSSLAAFHSFDTFQPSRILPGNVPFTFLRFHARVIALCRTRAKILCSNGCRGHLDLYILP